MADVNLTQEETLNFEGLSYFKQKQDALNDQKIATAKDEAIAHADELAEGLEVKGTAQTKVDELANGAVKDNTEAIAKLNGDAETEGSVAKAVADAKTELEGKITDSEYDDTEVRGLISDLDENKADKTQVATDIESAVKTETDARVEAVKGVQDEVDALEQTVADNKTAVEARVKAIEDDYLVEADKTELQGNIDALAGKVGEVAEGKTLAGLVADNTQAIATLNGEGEGSVKKTVDDAINKFATDVTDDAVVNSYKELIDWVAEHGSEAAEMAEAIQTNKTDIVELEALVGTLPEGATATTVVELIQSLVNTEKTRAEGVEGGLDERLQAVESKVGEAVDTQISDAIAELDADVTSATVEEGKGIQVQIVETDGKVATVAVTGNYDNSYDAKGSANTALESAKSYADGKDEAIADAKKAGTDAATAVAALENGKVADNATAIANIQASMPTAITNAQIDTLFADTAE